MEIERSINQEMKIFKATTFVILMFITGGLISCQKEIKNKIQRRNFPDPYAESFYDKNLKMLVAYDKEAPGIADTVLFDEQGNIVSEKRMWTYKRWAYDSLHFVTRELMRGEQFHNYQVAYSFKTDNQLIQMWRGVESFSWELDSIKFSSTDTFSIEYTLDDRGYISNLVDFKDGTHTNFKYNDDNQLIRKETFDSDNKNLVEEWIYEYKNDKLSGAKQFVRGNALMEYFFSTEGLIDSALSEGKVAIKYKYKYYQ